MFKNGSLYLPVHTPLGYRLWDSSDLSISNTEYLARGLNSSLYCPGSKNYKISGNYLSKSFNYVSAKIIKCIGTGWQSSTAIDSALQQIIVSVAIIGSYMDFNDYKLLII